MRVINPIEDDIKLIEQRHQQLEEIISELEDSSGVITYGLVGLLSRLQMLKCRKKVRI